MAEALKEVPFRADPDPKYVGGNMMRLPLRYPMIRLLFWRAEEEHVEMDGIGTRIFRELFGANDVALLRPLMKFLVFISRVVAEPELKH